ncbi:NADH-quinone oxidoreductase subunit C [Deinococcus soli (ex Cha et al. 2016)]|uniref:NADH-quinone oxidoreductase subunit C n=2 Tax=Deinococcus soli (ex Cha et al. 2016) TaxID=1309411 RepID=A0AAE4BP08_9DEIO|nr:NADH-quinone oxidoreductase subunit C [Deinococcus soli (ex Cha et al. 2016)]MDR6220117.1 NADH-quinone oxidoreductase subunit C [Deinococcus soli (ex Cha et al. 2016)]MDR6329972.1 NADH-quinone oxidoreductase subunit C [Deinococcus soli (ex Cha et al. 2016)]MDR6753397.1 NADH-quinone oxidoreductase subunit C [Deinococcus soli (ex Cha et al. 2016)]
MDPLKPGDAKPMGREGVAQSSTSAAPVVPSPAPVTPAAPSRDVAPLIAELGLTEDHAAEPTALVTPGDLHRAAQALKDHGFMLMDTVGIDYSTYTEARPKRFAVLHNLYHPRDHRRLFLRVWLDDGETLPSLYPIWRAANYLEREVYDLLGVTFTGHPDLRKVLTPDDLEGHPLRKDFPLGETPTLFRDGRHLDPAAFRAGLTGRDAGLTGYRGELRRGRGEDRLPPVMPEGGPK